MTPTVMKTKKSESTKFKRTRLSMARNLKKFDKHVKASMVERNTIIFSCFYIIF